MTGFVHLHVHTEYSLLAGAIRIPDLIARAELCQHQAVAMTDLGNVFGGVEFFQEAKKKGIKPILGATLFLPSQDDHAKREFRRGQDSLWHLNLLVKDAEGYKNLCRLLTLGYLEGFYYKPRVDTQQLQEYSRGLIALSGGTNGEVAYHFFKNRPEEAKAAAEKFLKIFKNNFYLSLGDNGLQFQPELNAATLELGKTLGIPCVATNAVHYLDRSDAEAFEVLRGIALMRQWDSEVDATKFSTDAYHYRTTDEMRELFGHCPETLSLTEEIAAQCDFQYDFKTYHFPKFQTAEGVTLEQELERNAYEGLRQRWPEIELVSRKTDADKIVYEERLASEIECIRKMGFAGYFLIVSDFIRWAKKQDIPVGPGRGSAAGSLVAYCLQITDLDPIPYNLLFERFLNPERVSMPDVDVDFCQDRRGEVIHYVAQKYGNVSQIITFGKMKAKAVIRDVGRVMEMEYDFVDKIAKLIPNELNIRLAGALEQEPRLQEMCDEDPSVARLIAVSLKLEGMSRHASVHAAGVIITDKPIWEIAPLYKGSSEDVVVQYDMKSAEKVGLIKFDFLGLKTLTVIHNALKILRVTRNLDLKIAAIPTDDKTVFDLLSAGDGVGVFQLESEGMRVLMTRLKPSVFEDIIALVALYRPGPMDLIPDFIERKQGRQSVDCLDPRLEPILGPTYGIMVYQEQVMQIAQILGGYTLGGADLLRRAMGKKDVKEMARHREIFREGAAKNDISAERADFIFSLMEKFAGYGFNKSHAAAYALVSYQTAYLKTHYYPEYMAALMTSECEDTDKLLVFWQDLKAHRCELLPPDIQLSEKDFTVQNGKIRYSLNAIKGVGAAAIESIQEARQQGTFKSLFDFCRRVDLRRVTKKVLEMLIKSGAFDGFGMTRRQMFLSIEAIANTATTIQKDEERGQSDLFAEDDTERTLPTGVVVSDTSEWTPSEKLAFEKEAFGFYFSDHPLSTYGNDLQRLTTHTIYQLKNQPVDTDAEVIVGGILSQHRVITTKKGDRMAFGTLVDLTASFELVIFARVYAECRDILESDKPVLVKGRIDRSGEDVKMIAESMVPLAESLIQSTRTIHIDVLLEQFSSERVENLMTCLRRHPGPSQVIVRLKSPGKFEAAVDLGSIRVSATEALRYSVDAVFADQVVHFG